jgi:hypothetical protein
MTSYERLKSELAEIVELVESLPDRYRDRSFELLLSGLLAEPGQAGPPPPPAEQRTPGKLTVPARVRAFLGRHSITQDQLGLLVLMENDDVHFIRQPEGVKVAPGQIQWALLLALKSALLGGEMSVDPEAVRSICIERGLYDKANFASNFKKAANASLFQKTPEPQGPAVKLSQDGEKRLAELIKSLTAGA